MKPVLFLDSGIGGIPYCRHFLERNPGESIIYLADRQHFPYGTWKKEDLAAYLAKFAEQLIQKFDPKIAVIVCNTATLAAMGELRERFPALPFVGTIPAVKPASLASKTGRIGVLGTELTINEPYIRELAAQYGGGEIIGIAAPELVEFVENCFYYATDEEKREQALEYLGRFRAAGADTLVLACTHFLFLQEEFQREAAPDIAVFDSIMGITARIETLLAETALTEDSGPPGRDRRQGRMFLTGTAAPEPSWTAWAESLGFSLSLL